MKQRTYQNFIQGKFTASKTKRIFLNRNPANTKDVIGAFPRSGRDDVDRAVTAAAAAYASWSRVTPPARSRTLFKAGEIMAQRKDEIAAVIVREMGKTHKESLGDVQSGIDMAYFAAGEGRRLYGETTHSELSRRLAMTRRVPLGVCALITPWNAPMAAIAWKVFPALICGNTVVLKPSEDTPLTAHILAEILIEAGLPAGVFNLIHGFGEEAGEALVRHPLVNLISFTGSSEVGKRINELVAGRLIKVSLEMGGKNGLLVLEDADLDGAADSIISGAFSMAGQRCASTSRIIVHKKVHDALLKKIISRAEALVVGPGHEEATHVCPLINETQMVRVLGYIKTAVREKAKLVLGGERITEEGYKNGFFIRPTIFTNVKSSMQIFIEEVFGPVLAVTACSSFDEGVKLMNSTPYALTASVHTKDINKAMEAVDAIHAGVVYVNAPTFGSEVHLPFGGPKMSGNGHREAGMGGFDVFSDWKTVYIDYSGAARNSQFSTSAEKKI